MKALSVEMACLLGIQNEIQAVCILTSHAWRPRVLAMQRPLFASNFECPTWKLHTQILLDRLLARDICRTGISRRLLTCKNWEGDRGGCYQSHYPIVSSSKTSRLEARAGFFRLLLKGIFDPYVLWPFDKKLIF